MTLLKLLKRSVLRVSHATGLSGLGLNSRWRQKRLAILCYHAATTGDEHECFPGFFMPAEMFRARLEFLRRTRANILPLDEALRRLYSGSLPPRSVALTLDDGFYAAYRDCRPVLKEYGYPYTVYMTTYYLEYNRPVFDPMCGYLLWKARGRRLQWDGVLSSPVVLDDKGRADAESAICRHAAQHGLSGCDKDALLAELAGRLDIDYEALCRKRVLHLVNSEEARTWAGEADIQLHTHRHRVSRSKDALFAQLEKNRERLKNVLGKTCVHLAYPGGACLPEYSGWLREFGLESAVTCQTGLASARSDQMLLPRVMETAHVTLPELAGWVTGVNGFLPVRRVDRRPALRTQFLEHDEPASSE